MKKSIKSLPDLLVELEGLPGGKRHTQTCYICRNIAGHLRGIVVLNENQLRNTEAHLLAQIALRTAASPF
ncbi:hypothetical protein ES705_44814 [subsurface metagenome]